MSAENWRELLWQDGIEDVVLRAVRAVEAADRRAARGSVGDYESFAWDAAVEIATKYSGDTATFDRWLYYGLTRFAVQSNRDQRFGKPGSPRRNGAYAVSFDDREDGGDGQGAEASASLTSHRITPDDPLALLLRIERLERAVRQAVIKEGSDRRLTYVTRTGDDLCIEPMCLRKAETQGRCVRHYAQHYQRWGRADGSSPTCANGGCNAVATSRGLCHPHYIEDRARQIAAGTWQPVSHPTACSVEGCERPHAAKGLCATHWKRLRTTGTTDDPPPPTATCTIEGCSRPHAARGMCLMHYRRLRNTGSTDGRTRATCSVDGCGRPAHGRGLCGTHYSQALRRERTAT